MLSVSDWINKQIAIEARGGKKITYEEWCDIRRNGTPEEIEEAVERMMLQGGYDCLA
jgi:hypothetical protein